MVANLRPQLLTRPEPLRATRAAWTGTLVTSATTMPVRAYKANHEESTTRNKRLHHACQTPISMKTWCSECQAELQAEDVGTYTRHNGTWAPKDSKRADAADAYEIVAGYPVKLEPWKVAQSYWLRPGNQRNAMVRAFEDTGLEIRDSYIGCQVTLLTSTREACLYVADGTLVLSVCHETPQYRPEER